MNFGIGELALSLSFSLLSTLRRDNAVHSRCLLSSLGTVDDYFARRQDFVASDLASPTVHPILGSALFRIGIVPGTVFNLGRFLEELKKVFVGVGGPIRVAQGQTASATPSSSSALTFLSLDLDLHG